MWHGHLGRDRACAEPVLSEAKECRYRRELTHCMEIACHSEPFAVILSEAKDLALGAQDKLREESRPGPCPVNHSTQSEIPRSARNDISWVPGAARGVRDCHPMK
jgi:hypothetical protein